MRGAGWVIGVLACVGAGCVEAPGPRPVLSPAVDPATAPVRISAGPDEARSLPTLEQEIAARRERDLQKARESGLPTLQDELRAKRDREAATAPVAASPAQPVPPVPQPAEEAVQPVQPVQPVTVTAEDFRPGWWLEAPVEQGGSVRAAARGEGGTLIEARRAAVEAARGVIQGVVGSSGRIAEAPLNSAAVRLSDGRYRAFVLMEGTR